MGEPLYSRLAGRGARCVAAGLFITLISTPGPAQAIDFGVRVYGGATGNAGGNIQTDNVDTGFLAGQTSVTENNQSIAVTGPNMSNSVATAGGEASMGTLNVGGAAQASTINYATALGGMSATWQDYLTITSAEPFGTPVTLTGVMEVFDNLHPVTGAPLSSQVQGSVLTPQGGLNLSFIDPPRSGSVNVLQESFTEDVGTTWLIQGSLYALASTSVSEDYTFASAKASTNAISYFYLKAPQGCTVTSLSGHDYALNSSVVPEASTSWSYGILLMLGLATVIVKGRRRHTAKM